MFYDLLVFCRIEHLKISSLRRVSNYDQVIVVLRLIPNKLMINGSSIDQATAHPSVMVSVQVLTGIRVADFTLSAIVISTLSESAEPQCRSMVSL